MARPRRVVTESMGTDEMNELRAQVEPLLQEAGRIDVAINAVDVIRLLNAGETQQRELMAAREVIRIWRKLDNVITQDAGIAATTAHDLLKALDVYDSLTQCSTTEMESE